MRTFALFLGRTRAAPEPTFRSLPVLPMLGYTQERGTLIVESQAIMPAFTGFGRNAAEHILEN